MSSLDVTAKSLERVGAAATPLLKSRTAVSPLTVLLIAGWFGLLTGALEGVTATLLRGVPGFVMRVSPEILWAAPSFNLIVFLLVGGALTVVFRLRGNLPEARLVIGLFSWMTLFCVLLLIDKINQIAALLLTLGLAVQIARRFRGREAQGTTFFLKTAKVLVAITLLLSLGGAFWDKGRERYAVSNLPASPAQLPNILVITLDTLRADHLSSDGYSRDTSPNLKRLSETGVYFENAFANSSWTLPTHATLFTGRLPYEHQADWTNPLNQRFTTLAEALAARGYLTGAFSANTSYVAPEWGLARGFTNFESHGSSLIGDAASTVYGRKLAVTLLPRLGYFDIPGRKRAPQVNEEFLRWLDRSQRTPFFAFLNYFDLHDPYLTTASHQQRFTQQPARGNLINFQFQAGTFRRKPTLNKQEIQSEVDSYDACLSYLDEKLGELFKELDRRGVLNNTLLIVTSDHGEAFGDHDLFGHGNSLYMETLRVPLIFVWPGRVPAGQRVSQVTSLHHLPATIMDLLGFEDSQFPGITMARLWSAGSSTLTAPVLSELSPGRFREGPPHYPAAKGAMRSLITDEWHFISWESGVVELYAWKKDKTESQNLAHTPETRTVVEEFKKHLASLATTHSE